MDRNISDYGVIGNMRTAALVSSNGSIDYCSPPYFDSPTVFAALLDERKGGYFSLKPAEAFSSKREYLSGTCILCTSFTTDNGKATLYDMTSCRLKKSSFTNAPRAFITAFASIKAK
ncbi:DUF5911 domain-containing protein [Chlorobaculum sp. MV4-Y]|jgi:GH15 family glucan-1,4-alpha-glucosidase|uniref:trehalase-like domain-containing protein n=1 Tax=Chlorobaculum sp. MV4-Y TaxID=2976335 RepID=UPI0021AF9DFA|nr:trehalase-like domain-containing protein [Chlorobaculum sp. MV4-Y]UWX58272.1 DUF5911 domain-containing protein [Chlorobaculum sp. MV4-Y]